MQFVAVSINYRNAALNVRDLVAFTDSKKIGMLEALYQNGIKQSMVVSTCNRSEVYYFCPEGGESEGLSCFKAMFPDVDILKYAEWKQGKEAYRHLFLVTAGLLSMVTGEDQILGQVQEALDFSRTMGYCGKELNKAVRDAVTCAKRMKTELRISEIPLSVSYIGIRKLEKECGLRGRAVFLIGSGKMAALALKYVLEYGAKEVFLCSRSIEHAKQLKQEFPQLRICSYERRYLCMRGCDVIISATSAPHPVVRKEEFSHEGEVFLLDLASPRDIEPELALEPMVHLFDIDSLKKTADENLRQRGLLVEQGRAMAEEEVEKTFAWMLASRMDDAIESLQQRCSDILTDSLSYINRKLELDSHERKVVENTLHASLQRLIREPIHTLKQLDSEEQQDRYREFVADLFQL